MERLLSPFPSSAPVADASPSSSSAGPIPSTDVTTEEPASQPKKRRLSPATPKAPSAKLRSLAVPKCDEPVAVAPLDLRVFASWDAFDAHFDEYCARTFQVFRSSTCVPVSARNARVLERIEAKGFGAQYERYKIIPDEFETYSRTLVCTHAGAPRHRNEGLRPNRNMRALGCPAKLNLLVHRINNTVDGPWRVHVTDQVASHNHVVSEAQFKLYPQQRRVTDPDVLRTVRAMRKYGTPRRGIFDYIKDATGLEAITIRDVTNLLNKMKAEDEREEAATNVTTPEPSPDTA